MYKCLSCGHIFDEPKQCCPLCSEAYEEAKQCEICGEYFTSDELTDTTEYINGGCGDCCEQCIEDGGMICL